MAKITRIKASDGPRETEEKPKKPEPAKKPEAVKKMEPTKKAEVMKNAEPAKKPEAAQKVESAKKAKSTTKVEAKKKPFILIRPFVAFFRYLRDAWKEIRQVRWPSRKATWKMVLAVLVYTALFVVIISLLDLFFTWLFGLILG